MLTLCRRIRLRRQMLKWSLTTRTRCQHSCWLWWHSIGVVKDLLDICQHSQGLCGHGVGVVKDYADTLLAQSITMRTQQILCRHFEGFSHILKEQSGEKRYMRVFTTYKPKTNNLKVWIRPYLKKNLRVRIIVLAFMIHRISSWKRQSSQNRFCLFIWSPDRIL